MACVLVPAAEAIVTTIVKKTLEKSDKKTTVALSDGKSYVKTSFVEKLGWLNKMLWGGSVLLGFEHVWHGEIVPFFPFLTAAKTPESTVEMIKEMSTAGVGMAVLVTLIWGIMVIGSVLVEKKAEAKA